VKDLDAHTRILHLMVCQCFDLRKGGYTNISKEDMYFMYKIIIDDPPNLGAFIIRRMIRAIGWSKNKENTYSLPYGKLVSLIIGRECSVPTYEFTAKTVTLNILNKSALRKMNFEWNEQTKEWMKMKKKSPTQEAVTEAAPEAATEALLPREAAAEVNEESVPVPDRSAAAGTSSAAAAGTSSAVPEPDRSNAGLAELNSKLEFMLEAMLARMDAGFAGMETRLNRMEIRLDAVENRIQEYFNSIGA